MDTKINDRISVLCEIRRMNSLLDVTVISRSYQQLVVLFSDIAGLVKGELAHETHSLEVLAD
jgi:ribosome-binding ATPase YchF (GTP1/OBG family)